MPRGARLKLTHEAAYYHVVNRVAGPPKWYPFGDVEKDHLIRLFRDLSRLYTVEVIAVTAMGNHWHAVCFVPPKPLSRAETAKRWNRYYGVSRPRLSPDDARCERIAADLNDLSCFLGVVQQSFTTWFNRTRPDGRRGRLWAARFKSVVLDRGNAVWECVKYVEMNPVRARLTADPADYRFCTWGMWHGSGRHPFAENLQRHVRAHFGEIASNWGLEDVRRELRTEFARVLTNENDGTAQEVDQAILRAGQEDPFALTLQRRVRYWTDGLIIGSKTFVMNAAAGFYPPERVARHRLQRAGPLPQGGQATPLHAYRRLRVLRT